MKKETNHKSKSQGQHAPAPRVKNAYYKGRTFHVELEPDSYLDTDTFQFNYTADLVNPDFYEQNVKFFPMKRNGFILSIRKMHLPNNFFFQVSVIRNNTLKNGTTVGVSNISQQVLFAEPNVKEALIHFGLSDEIFDIMDDVSCGDPDCIFCGNKSPNNEHDYEDLFPIDEYDMPPRRPSLSQLPPPYTPLEALNQDLKNAVGREDYEAAARIRDKIVKLKK